MTEEEFENVSTCGECLAKMDRHDQTLAELGVDGTIEEMRKKFVKAVEAADGDLNSIFYGMAELMLTMSKLGHAEGPSDEELDIRMRFAVFGDAVMSVVASVNMAAAVRDGKIAAALRPALCQCADCRKERASGQKGADDDRR